MKVFKFLSSFGKNKDKLNCTSYLLKSVEKVVNPLVIFFRIVYMILIETLYHFTVLEWKKIALTWRILVHQVVLMIF